ncbi:MAG: hypothetical protein WB439_14065 [Acidobacteriaceae bacterium]
MSQHRNEIDLEQSHSELHDLCQPLTALQCCLEMSRMPGHDEALEVAIDESLRQTQRIFAIVARMRQRLLRIEQETESEAQAFAAR